jgi:hypothetical protein
LVQAGIEIVMRKITISEWSGKKFMMNNGQELEIIEYFNSKNVTIKFDNGHIRTNMDYHQVKAGKVKNPQLASVLNFGYIGNGPHTACENGVKTIKYNVWKNMLTRVLNPKYHESHPTYIGTQIFKGWANFQAFGEWFDENYVDGFVLDKDILVKGNKAYHPLRCCFVPHEMNNLMILQINQRTDLPIGVSRNNNNKYYGHFGFGGQQIFGPSLNTPEKAFEWYKQEKESCIKSLANKWKSQINERVFNVLVNYQVEITD